MDGRAAGSNDTAHVVGRPDADADVAGALRGLHNGDHRRDQSQIGVAGIVHEDLVADAQRIPLEPQRGVGLTPPSAFTRWNPL